MRWDKVKTDIACDLFTQITNGRYNGQMLTDIAYSDFEQVRGRTHLQVVEAYAGAVYRAVMAWDVRSVEGLRRRFPELWPKSLSKGVLIADQDENSNWCVSVE